MCDNIPVGIHEHLVNFMIVGESTGKSLLDLLLSELAELGLWSDDIQGQGYDNGANKKGHKCGVQARLLQLNPQAFFTPCVCHNNLMLGDIASSCCEALIFWRHTTYLCLLLGFDRAMGNLPATRQQEARLSPSDCTMRLVSSNLASCHATEQKLLIRQVLTKLMV